MNKLKALLVIVSGVVTAVPGLSALITGLGVPPGRDELFGAVSLAAGSLVILVLTLVRQRIGAIHPRKVVTITAVAAIVWLLCLCAHFLLVGHCIFKDVRTGVAEEPTITLYLPLISSGETAGAIEEYGGHGAAVNRIPLGMRSYLSNQTSALALTTALFLLLYTAIVSIVTFAFAFIGFSVLVAEKPPEP